MIRFRRDGSQFAGWPVAGVSLSKEPGAAWAPDGVSGVWSFTLTSHQACSSSEPLPCSFWTTVAATRVDGNGNVVPGSPISLLARSRQVLPRLALDPLANVFVLWLDERSGKLEAYVQKFGADLPVPVQVQHATARLANQGVELAWDLRDVATANLKVERVVDVEGWSELGQPEAAAAPDHWVFMDRRPVRGAHATYRLRNSTSGW